MKARTLIAFLFLLGQSTIITIDAQTPYTSHEIGASIGDSYYLGELNNTHFLPFNLAGGAYYRYNYDRRMSFRFGGHYLPIQSGTTNNAIDNVRNVTFASKIYELQALFEFNFLPFSHLDPKGPVATPYAFLGLAEFFHDLDNNAEGVSYKKFQTSIPMGLGIKYRVGKATFALEWGIRKTFTDYLDGVSGYFLNSISIDKEGNIVQVENFQRGEIYNKDWHVYSGLSINVNLTSNPVCRSH